MGVCIYVKYTTLMHRFGYFRFTFSFPIWHVHVSH